MDRSEAGVNIVLIQTFYVNQVILMLTSQFFKDNFHNKAKKVCQNKVNLSLTFTRRLEY